MAIRKGVSAIVFFEERGKRKYLLLKRKLNWKGWEFLKGGVKGKESEKKCLKREIKEEVGITNFESIKTKEIHRFDYPKSYIKDNKVWSGAKNRVYLIRIFDKKIKLDSHEHSGFKWVNEKDVLKLLNWKDYKRIFRKVIKN